jgi:hypothetical protein
MTSPQIIEAPKSGKLAGVENGFTIGEDPIGGKPRPIIKCPSRNKSVLYLISMIPGGNCGAAKWASIFGTDIFNASYVFMDPVRTKTAIVYFEKFC